MKDTHTDAEKKAPHKDASKAGHDSSPSPAAIPAASPIALREEEILAFWQKEGIFEKTNEARAHAPEFSFYDGPPFATGTPHYGHLLAGTIKDAIPRYQIMKGKKVRRQWGWDCHGLPLENLIEKELGLKTKKDIEDMGIRKFNAAAAAAVLRYENEWKKIIPRMGRFVDMEHPYKTMDATYTESIWWIFKTLFDRGLIYKGYKSMHLCPRCETTLSNFEVNQGYKDITDISVTAEFELVEKPGTFLLAWTTTPWTLPGNAALAINPEIEYVEVIGEKPNNKYILAKARLEKAFGSDASKYKIVRAVPADELVGKAYKPIFDYYTHAHFTHPDRAWKVYAADFVTTTDGTGVVHIAPAFGSDDLELARKHHIPPIHHVGMDGRFKAQVGDGLAGMQVKPKDGATKEEKDLHQKTDVEIIKLLAAKGVLFSKEKIIHSYPHCWRCDTPLLNYATSSWFVNVQEIKQKLVEENKKIQWVPESIGEYRFGNWIEGAPDWAISRSRYWGAPLPVWISEDGEDMRVLGSIADLKKHLPARNKYFIMRHGQAENNVRQIISSRPENPHHLTDMGKEQALAAAQSLKGKGIDLIIASPFVRTQETAAIVAKELGLEASAIITNDEIGEIRALSCEGEPISQYHSLIKPLIESFDVMPDGCESYGHLKQRMGDFLYGVDKRFEGKTILIVTHDSPAWLLSAAAQGFDQKQSVAIRIPGEYFLQNAQIKELPFSPLPHNADYELDFHRPFIDEIEFSATVVSKDPTKKGTAEAEKIQKFKRIPEVFDCWFESGSMPYGQFHFMGGETKNGPALPPSFPADFIAEGLDQTRGWFYSLLVLGVALFGKSPYKSVVVNGLILAEDGQKMSKSKQNYPDPMSLVNKFGADAVRFYLLNSPSVHADDFNFSEKGVDEVYRKNIQRVQNVVAFYEMYADKASHAKKVDASHTPSSKNVLDQWLLARLVELEGEVSRSLDRYELDRAARPFESFIDDLSTWYLRRSRDRFKNESGTAESGADKLSALETTRFVLLQFSKLIAPFMPFLAEDLHMRLGGETESVHLEDWPKLPSAKEEKDSASVLDLMKKVRMAVTLGLEARAKAGMKVRQPLAKLTLKSSDIGGHPHLLDLIKDEVNIKDVAFSDTQAEEAVLDTALTPALQEEGDLRELMRAIQDQRKKDNFKVGELAHASVTAPALYEGIVKKYQAELKAACSLSSVDFAPGETILVRLER